VKNSIYTLEYQRFLKNLKQARKEAGFTQVEIAKKLKQPQSYISKCESGEKRVDIIELLRFARAYKKPIDYFIKDIIEK
jgi:transcriptional regulator with XRE-family HTH domain